jgi:hypothetical protein
MKISPVGAELHADGQTDMTKLIIVFYSFRTRLKRSQSHPAEKGVCYASYVDVPQLINSVDTLQRETFLENVKNRHAQPWMALLIV